MKSCQIKAKYKIFMIMKNTFIYFFICARLELLWFPAIWLAARAGGFLRYLGPRAKRVYIFLKCHCNEKIFEPILNTTEQHF